MNNFTKGVLTFSALMMVGLLVGTVVGSLVGVGVAWMLGGEVGRDEVFRIVNNSITASAAATTMILVLGVGKPATKK